MTRRQQISDAAQMCDLCGNLHDLDCFVAGAEWADSHPHWHKYPEEKPPKPGKPVLCRTAKGTYVVAQQKEKLIGGKPSGQYHWSRWNAPIIAWMELPQPPKFE